MKFKVVIDPDETTIKLRPSGVHERIAIEPLAKFKCAFVNINRGAYSPRHIEEIELALVSELVDYNPEYREETQQLKLIAEKAHAYILHPRSTRARNLAQWDAPDLRQRCLRQSLPGRRAADDPRRKLQQSSGVRHRRRGDDRYRGMVLWQLGDG